MPIFLSLICFLLIMYMWIHGFMPMNAAWFLYKPEISNPLAARVRGGYEPPDMGVVIKH